VHRPVHEQRKQAYNDLQKQLKAATAEETASDTSKHKFLKDKERVTRRIQEISSKAKARIDVSDLETELEGTEAEIAAKMAALQAVEVKKTELEAHCAPLQAAVDAISAEREAAKQTADAHAEAYDVAEKAETALKQVAVKAAVFLKTRQAAADEASAALIRAEAAHKKALEQAEVSSTIAILYCILCHAMLSYAVYCSAEY
jgi:colicin import membrane protein